MPSDTYLDTFRKFTITVVREMAPSQSEATSSTLEAAEKAQGPTTGQLRREDAKEDGHRGRGRVPVRDAGRVGVEVEVETTEEVIN